MTAVVRGTAGAPGLALGRIVRLEGPGGQPRVDVDRSGNPGERLATAQAQVAAHLEDLAAELRAEGKADEAAIFDAQALLASDRALADHAFLALLRMHVDVGARDVDVAAEDHFAP